jgi:transposase InsO family protein
VWQILQGDLSLTSRGFQSALGTGATGRPAATTATARVTWASPVIDFGDRSVLAIGVSKSQEAEMVLAPLRTALEEAFATPEGVAEDLEMHTDHGPQYTWSVCHTECTTWRVAHTFAPAGRPTGNATTERVILTKIVARVWAQDWESADELRRTLEAWRLRYNHQRPHESLAWRTQKRAENGVAAARAVG